MRTQFSKPEWRRYFAEQGNNINMLYLSFRVRIIFRPKNHKFAQVMWSKDRPVSGEVIKVVHDDSNKQVENQEGTNDEESDKVNVGKIRATARFLTSIVRLKTLLVLASFGY